MRIAIHPGLVEGAVFHACRASAARGDPAPGEWLARALERAYRLPEGRDRDLRFGRVHAVAFRRMGLARALHGVFAAHPSLSLADGPVRVGPAPGRGKEGVDLHERWGGDGRPLRSVVASILPSTLADPEAAARRLHREAAKTADLLDPAFAWKEEPPEPTPARRESVRLRYGAAWDAWTDGRLERRGLPGPATPEEGEAAFAAAFAGSLGEEGAREAYGLARSRRTWTHGGLLALARTPARAGEGQPMGSLCPFCRFPTHDWEPDPGRLGPGALVAALGSDPTWTPNLGLCGQCSDLFRARSGLAAHSPV